MYYTTKTVPNFYLLDNEGVSVFRGGEKCAESHDLRANSHTLHGVNVKKASFWGSL